MASGSLKALLAVLAVAGYQNRDKLGEILKKVTERPGQTPQPASPSEAGHASTERPDGARSSQSSGGLDDLLDGLRGGGLGGVLGGAGLGSILGGGLNDLLDQFRQAGQGNKAESWVRTGANEPINDGELRQALGPEVLHDLAAKTGLSEEEVLSRLSRNLPDAVDRLTPDGRVPPV